MSEKNFPVAAALGRQAKNPETRQGFKTPKQSGGREKIDLAQIKANLNGQFADKYVNELETDRRVGAPAIRRRAALALEAVRQIRDGKVDKHWLERHNAIYVDDDNDAYDGPFRGSWIEDTGGLDLSDVPEDIPYQDPNAPDPEKEKRLQQAEAERIKQMKPAEYRTPPKY